MRLVIGSIHQALRKSDAMNGRLNAIDVIFFSFYIFVLLALPILLYRHIPEIIFGIVFVFGVCTWPFARVWIFKSLLKWLQRRDRLP
jgi:hypothetical protein